MGEPEALFRGTNHKKETKMGPKMECVKCLTIPGMRLEANEVGLEGREITFYRTNPKHVVYCEACVEAAGMEAQGTLEQIYPVK